MNKEKQTKNTWLIILAGLLVLALILIPLNKHDIEESAQNFSKEQMCQNIKGTPSWADQYGQIYDSGYKPLPNMSYNFVEELINNKTYFLYDPYCVHCQRQIKEFEERWKGSWQQYLDSGYAVNCREVLLNET